MLIDGFFKVYFGFSNCPDICPDELDKMAEMHELVKKRVGNVMRPIMITCDPQRDSPAILNSYLAEFHPEIIGLTGEFDEIKATCKSYRVYFSTPANIKPGQDYLVDHSIYFFLMGMSLYSDIFSFSMANGWTGRPRGRLRRGDRPQLHGRAGRDPDLEPRQGLGPRARPVVIPKRSSLSHSDRYIPSFRFTLYTRIPLCFDPRCRSEYPVNARTNATPIGIMLNPFSVSSPKVE